MWIKITSICQMTSDNNHKLSPFRWPLTNYFPFLYYIEVNSLTLDPADIISTMEMLIPFNSWMPLSTSSSFLDPHEYPLTIPGCPWVPPHHFWIPLSTPIISRFSWQNINICMFISLPHHFWDLLSSLSSFLGPHESTCHHF